MMLPKIFDFVLFSFSCETTGSRHAGSMPWPLCIPFRVAWDHVNNELQCIFIKLESSVDVTSIKIIFQVWLWLALYFIQQCAIVSNPSKVCSHKKIAKFKWSCFPPIWWNIFIKLEGRVNVTLCDFSISRGVNFMVLFR